MGTIIKYQLKESKNRALFILGLLAVFHVIAWFFELREIMLGTYTFTASVKFWIFLSMSVTFIMLIIQFFRCASGHTDQLLYRDTSYLMLTVPRHGWEILGGRFIAGLIEFVIYLAGAGVLLLVHAATIFTLARSGAVVFFDVLEYGLKHIFVDNFVFSLQMLLIMLCMYSVTGICLTFAFVASRSFIKRKSIATIVSVLGFIFITNWTLYFGNVLSERYNWYAKMTLTIDTLPYTGMHSLDRIANSNLIVQDMFFPVAPLVFFIILGAGLFAAASWLMEKKVEV
ncbi:hypothetical protein K7I13_05415 [Brucepastera parasyntrophica]|uniref:hypothetical protein n=1 Tax=Brucepastera parasyntrophica TaxID=2880008 RepID=UPI00210D7942|nr:hypothetical protein [Brucepastera parasyntrophica]ULQ60711.1 hypothetical protein K7I13_05415 [Brucepastera parasyntrophica]